MIAQNAAQKMNQEYEPLTLKQQEEIETLKQRKREDREKEKQSGDQRVNEIQVQLDKMKAETKVRLAKIQQESAVTVQNIMADGELEVAGEARAAEAGRAHRDEGQGAGAEAQKTEVGDGRVREWRKGSRRRGCRATRNAAADRPSSMAKAEGVAAPYVEARKQFETRHKQMPRWESLARRTRTSSTPGEENPELNADPALGRDHGRHARGGRRSRQVLAEMLVMQRGSKVMLNLDKSGSVL